MRASNGYPLIIETLLSRPLTHSWISAGDASYSELVGRVVADLDPDVRMAAKKLALFTDPLPIDLWPAIILRSLAECHDLQYQLSEERLFTVSRSGRRWFHERRRLAILNTVTSPQEREALAEDCVRGLLQAVAEKADSRVLKHLQLTYVPADRLVEMAVALSMKPQDSRFWSVVGALVVDGPTSARRTVAAQIAALPNASAQALELAMRTGDDQVRTKAAARILSVRPPPEKVLPDALALSPREGRSGRRRPAPRARRSRRRGPRTTRR
jgi:hypothetical protein